VSPFYMGLWVEWLGGVEIVRKILYRCGKGTRALGELWHLGDERWVSRFDIYRGAQGVPGQKLSSPEGKGMEAKCIKELYNLKQLAKFNISVLRIIRRSFRT